jgi:16S rRNA processing protein RimM
MENSNICNKKELNSSKAKDSWVCVGVITRLIGIRGQVKVLPRTSTPKVFTSFKELYFSAVSDEEMSKIVPTNQRIDKKGQIVMQIANHSSRNDVEYLKLKSLYIPRSMLPKLDDDEYYLSDLYGLDVLNGNHIKIGIVQSAFDYGAGTFLDIKLASGKLAIIRFNKCIDVNLHNKTVCLKHNTVCLYQDFLS